MDTKIDIQTEDALESCFKQIINGNKLNLDINTLNSILHTNLGINFNILKPRLAYILPYMLVHFITTWPGWKKTSHYNTKQITFENWYKKFKEYLIYKINFMIKNDYDKALTMLKYNSIDFEEKLVETVDCSTQTSPCVEKVLAPFNIEIKGPPKVLNSLVFCEGPQDTVLVKEYKVNSLWGKQLNVRQLINWPWVEVVFKSQHIYFKRTNNHDFKRYLTFSSEKILFKKSDNFIEEIDIINEAIKREAYTLNAVKEYCNAYITFLRDQQLLLNWSENSLNDIEIVLENFILDIVDINMNSIATNTKVLFNIGNAIYARNKSIKTSDQSVCFSECLTPKLNLSLYSFTAITDPNMTSFQHIFSLKSVNEFLPNITYRCTFCDVLFFKSTELWEHFRTKHIMEQPVLCFRCKLQFKIANLTDHRWFHECSPPNPEDE